MSIKRELMAKHLTDNEKELLIADHKTGNFSQRKLSVKYKVSLGYVNKTIKEVDKIDIEVVNAGIAYKTELAKRDEHSVNAIEQVVNEKTKHLLFFTNSALKNQTLANKKLVEGIDLNDLEAHSRITSRNKDSVLGKEPTTKIDNVNAQQNNDKVIKVEYS